MKKFRYDGAPLVLALVLGRCWKKAFANPLCCRGEIFHLYLSTYIFGLLDCGRLVTNYPHYHSAKKALHLRGMLTDPVHDGHRKHNTESTEFIFPFLDLNRLGVNLNERYKGNLTTYEKF